EAQFFPTLVGDVQVLEAPANLCTGQGPFSVLRLGRAHRFDRQSCIQDTAVVVDFANPLALAIALVLVVEAGEDVLDRRNVRAGGVEVEGLVAHTALRSEE